jgi:hypothetical protein
VFAARTFANKADSPTLVDVLDGILQDGEQKGRYAKVRELKAAADTLSFMQEHRFERTEQNPDGGMESRAVEARCREPPTIRATPFAQRRNQEGRNDTASCQGQNKTD